jgi:hypothetical protein
MSALRLHLVERVLVDQQWAAGTSEAEYLADLRQAIRSPDARLVAYSARGGAIAATWGPNTLPAARRGPRPEDWLFVVYSADRGMLISGYQASGLATVRIPGSARWLT